MWRTGKWLSLAEADNKPSGLPCPHDFCRLSSELSSSSEPSIIAATLASLMLNRNSVASHRKNRSLTYHWAPSNAIAHLVDYSTTRQTTNPTTWRHISRFVFNPTLLFILKQSWCLWAAGIIPIYYQTNTILAMFILIVFFSLFFSHAALSAYSF